jgi:hypothetical protein
MRDYATKSEQIRKLRETRALAAERIDAQREADAKKNAEPLARSKASKAGT